MDSITLWFKLLPSRAPSPNVVWSQAERLAVGDVLPSVRRLRHWSTLPAPPFRGAADASHDDDDKIATDCIDFLKRTVTARAPRPVSRRLSSTHGDTHLK